MTPTYRPTVVQQLFDTRAGSSTLTSPSPSTVGVTLTLLCRSQVEQAVREIKRLLVEASAAALQAEMRNPTATAGRYSVV